MDLYNQKFLKEMYAKKDYDVTVKLKKKNITKNMF